MRRTWTVAAALGCLGLASCGATSPGASPPPGAGRSPLACPGPPAGGAGLLAGTVTLGPDGSIADLSPAPHPSYPPAAGDADLPVIPGTTVVVRAAATSSDPAVLQPQASPPPGSTIFRALRPGCAELRISSVLRSVAVRSAVS